MNDQILLVDDEPNVLQALRRGLRGKFQLQLAEGGSQALELLRKSGPFAVIVSDMQMPDVDGLTLLAESKRIFPDTIRVMLTGNADQQTAINAVNEGAIFRFLNKPCPAEKLAETLDAAIHQHQVQSIERTLLSRTLTGTIALISEFLSMANPPAFGRGSRLRGLAKQLCAHMQLEDSWQYEIAAMLSQIGCVAVPQHVQDKIANGQQLSEAEGEMFRSQAEVGSRLIAKVPRLEGVAAMISQQTNTSPANQEAKSSIEIGADMLRILTDFDLMCAHHSLSESILSLENDKSGRYNPLLLSAFSSMMLGNMEVISVMVSDLTERMTLEENVLTKNGDILITKGNELTTTLIHRLRAFERNATGVRQPFKVKCRVQDSEQGDISPS
jgi:response regulator RpfG family c-di-GMP phosphodiesterase